ncbi:MAG TPA: AraC family transcriptional regulator, partial [Flavisolibacter sp.]|nr:AraC family transcriptional regulator [Flavisolibacter sp.]
QRHRFFSIQFQPTGFYRIFGIPAVVFTNLMVQSPEDCKKSFLFLYEQLRETREINDMKTRCENYLLRELVSSTAKDPYNGILFIASRIVKSVGWLPVEKLASEANMSLKTFERKFTEQVGVRPKLYNRIVRFNKALAMKRGSPSPHWTSIAHACGYFDQMHFIKDFKLFSGVTPTDFFRQSPLPNEDVLKT